MFELNDYALTDFLLFSEETLLAMMAYYQHTVWPGHLVALVLLVFSVWQLCRHKGDGLPRVLVIFAVSWVWLALVYQKTFYADINWAANFFAVGFFAQALALLWSAYRIASQQHMIKPALGSTDSSAKQAVPGKGLKAGVMWRSGLMIVAFTGLLLSVLLKFHGRGWDQLEMVFLTPDATAIATIGLVIMLKPYQNLATSVLLITIPSIWCCISLLTAVAFAKLS